MSGLTSLTCLTIIMSHIIFLSFLNVFEVSKKLLFKFNTIIQFNNSTRVQISLSCVSNC